MSLKTLIRSVLIFLHIDLTKNLKYDRLTNKIIRKVLQPDSNCIDVGCHKGEILELMIQCAPQGRRFAFEPIPQMYRELKTRFGNQAEIFPYAVAAEAGHSTFQFVKNAPAYSGLLQRRYDVAHPEIEEIPVELRRLDEVIPKDVRINLIKIDVEGAEFGVLKGGVELLKRDKPCLIFECGLGGSDFYGTTPEAIYQFIQGEVGLGIYTLEGFLKKVPPMPLAQFKEYFDSNEEYYFVASA